MTNSWPNVFAIRLAHFIPVTLNATVYLVIWFLYSILVSIAKSEVVTNRTVTDLFTRVQLIIGVFMMFRLAMTIIQGIIDPDKFTDSKSGINNVIMKIITSLILLTLLVPVNIPKPSNQMNSFEKQVSGKGILFGVIYDFQSRVLEYNVLAKLILGTQSDSSTSTPGKDLSAVILKSFFTPNLKEGATDTFKLKQGDSGGLEFEKKDLFCDDTSSTNLYKKYYKSNDPIQILGWVNEGCRKKGVSSIPLVGDSNSNDYFAFNFNWFISLVVGIFVVVALASICVEVSKRAIKLAILRIIAPIPFISYMNPKSDMQNGPMGAWVKTLTSTYLELFIQLSIVYFVIFIIQSVRAGGLEFDQDASGMVWLFAHVFIYIGLLLFAKEAPKFFKQALGIKEDAGKGIFSGLKDIAGAGALGAAAIGGGISRGVAAYQNNGNNKGKAILSGMLGAGGGAINAGKGFFGGKSSKDIMASARSYNARNYANAEDDSTFSGRFKAGMQDKFGLKNDYQKMEDKIKNYGAAKDAMGRISNAFDSNGDYKFAYAGADIKDSKGNVLLKKGAQTSLKDLNDMYNRVQYSGDDTLIKAVDKAKKDAQGERFNDLRKEGREKIVEHIQNKDAGWSTNDLIAYDSAMTIHKVAQKYSTEAEFSHLAGTKFDDASTKWGPDWKHDAGSAGTSAEQIKNSAEFATAKADAQRVDQKKN